MARKKREWYPGATYHVMSRGNRRTAIFQDRSDYIHFLECLTIIKGKYPFDLHSICLMTNHFHMLITTHSTELWRIIQKLLSVYAEQFNHKYHFSGHLFEGRYASCIVEDDRYFLEVSRYIHLNPVKANMVREPLNYEYSSYKDFVKTPSNNSDNSQKTIDRNENNDVQETHVSRMISELVDTSRVLGCFRNNPSEQYRIFVEGKISHAEQELLIQKDMKEDDMWLPW